VSKKRIAVVSLEQKLVDEIKTEMGDIYVYHNKSVSDLIIALGTTKVEGVILHAGGEMDVTNLRAALSLLRQKASFKDCPIGFMHMIPKFKFKGLIFDSRLRSYSLKDGAFLPILDFKKLVNAYADTPNSLPGVDFTDQWISENFGQALQHNMEPATSFQVQEATDDELHAEFLAQTQGEVSSNLVWVKFSVRLLDTQTQGYRQLHKSLSREEIEDSALAFINRSTEQFIMFASAKIHESSALDLHRSSELTAPERSELTKRAKSSTVVFKSEHCNILVEKIRYC
jgi:hypothetical protein